MGEPLLVVDHLCKQFGGMRATNDVSFRIHPGEIVGVIGPNGAGKTTLIRCIMGILKPTSGRVIFKGEDITGLKTHKIVNRGMAATFQVVKPFRGLPVGANVLVPVLSPRGKKSGDWIKTAEQRALDALEFCGIADLAKEPASILSHGDLKRLEMARTIATEPELLILDEPLGGLNPAEATLMANSIKRLNKGGRFGRLHSEGPAMMIVEHKLSELMRIADRVIVIQLGRLIAEGTPQEIIRNEEVVSAYIGKGVKDLVS
ncbi:ABC transporter ATP-binding protein [bacterium]|nr:ABC transporter ATP-binding protein [bacterium]